LAERIARLRDAAAVRVREEPIWTEPKAKAFQRQHGENAASWLRCPARLCVRARDRRLHPSRHRRGGCVRRFAGVLAARNRRSAQTSSAAPGRPTCQKAFRPFRRHPVRRLLYAANVWTHHTGMRRPCVLAESTGLLA